MARPDAARASNTRRTIIRIAQKRARAGSGSLFARSERTKRLIWPDLSPVLAGLKWAIVGAVATRRYMPERTTRRLDLIIAARDMPVARERLLAAGYVSRGELTIGGTAWDSPAGVPLDVLACDAPWCEAALVDAAKNVDDGSPVLTLPYLVLMKLEASRAQDVAAVSRMLGLASEPELTAVRDVVLRYAGDLAEDLESLIALGQLETQGQP